MASDEKDDVLAVLPKDRQAAGKARAMVCDAFDRWGLRNGDDAAVVVSELVSNALVHGCEEKCGAPLSGLVIVRAWRRDDGRAVIEVWDCLPDRRPERRAEDLASESGRGMVLVEALCLAWGCRALDHGAGKIVWSVL